MAGGWCGCRKPGPLPSRWNSSSVGPLTEKRQKKPDQGSKQWWSDLGDDLKNALSRSIDLAGKAKASLELDGWWDIEKDYDYLYAEVSTYGGAHSSGHVTVTPGQLLRKRGLGTAYHDGCDPHR
ncbi:immune inhibitor A [Streptomyces sp. NA04227]|nr:immune inhibitor A [Streptomyces sp. NA04227]